MRFSIRLSGIAGLQGLLALSVAHANTYHVGPTCTYHDVATAATAAKAHAGADTIAVNTGTYALAATITLTDTSDLTIDGGYASCTATTSSGRSTLDANAMVTPGSMLYQHGTGALTLRHLNIRNNDYAVSGSTGGAIHSYQSGKLTLDQVSVDHNNASYGAGVYIEGDSATHAQLTLNNALFEYNNADFNGAGICATNTDINITGDTEFNINLAGGDGGAIYAGNSNITVKDHTPTDRYFLNSNVASNNGGGLFLKETLGGPYDITLQNDRADQPLVVENNTAGQNGGGFYLETSSNTQEIITSVTMYNMIFDTNFATNGRGAAIAIVANDRDALNNPGSFPIITNVNMYQSAPGDAIPHCLPGLECNAITNNESSSAVNYGAAVTAVQDEPVHAQANFHFDHGYFRGNAVNDALISGNGHIAIDSSLLAQNTTSHFLVETYDDLLEISNTTIAGNTVPSGQASVYALRAMLTFYHNLVDQPNATVCTVSSPVSTTVVDLGVSPTTAQDACTGTNVQVGFPSFVDAANGDFRLQYSSEARDRWAATGSSNAYVPSMDLDGYPRPYSLGGPTPFDFGAYEYGSERIFANGFEVP